MKQLILIGLTLFFSGGKLLCQNSFMKDGNIFVGGKEFRPIVMNYLVNIRYNENGDYWVAPASKYSTNPSRPICTNKQDCLSNISAHFESIRSMGFNTVRLVNIEFGIAPIDNAPPNQPALYAVTQYWGPIRFLEFTNPYTEHFQFIDDVLTIASNNNLKVILLSGGKEIDKYKFQDRYSEYLQQISKRFNNNTTLIAYDLLNEPEYFHQGHSKEAVCLMVNKWVKAIKDNTNNQLVTIGLATSKTTFNWDAAILNVDFISFHPYPKKSTNNENLLLAYSNELYWIGNTVKKPWLIGETGFTASGFNNLNFGNLTHQLDYAQLSSKLCFDCGGIGYSWWEYHDDIISPFDDDMSVIDIFDTQKPVVTAFNSLINYIPNKENCTIPKDYYNPTSYSNNWFAGIIFDTKGNPIQNAYIEGHSIGAGTGRTYSKSDGTFIVYSNNLIRSLTITAYGYKTTKRYRPFTNSKIIKLELAECGIEKYRKKYCRTQCKFVKKECKNVCKDFKRECKVECKDECTKNKGWKKWKCKRTCKKKCREAYRECKSECKDAFRVCKTECKSI